MRSLILVSIFLFNIFLPQISSLTCFNCGYLEMPDGKKINVTEEFGQIPFCDDFTQNEENIIEAYAGGCCSAFKIEIHQEGTDEKMFLSRHGTANDEDEVWANFTCGEESPGYTCKDEHIRQDGVDDDGRVCHCYDDFCNKDVPTPDDNTTPSPDPTPGPGTTCDTTCTTECSDMMAFHDLQSDATCSTSCQTSCFNNQGINDAIRHLQGTITKVVASQKNPPGPTSSPDPNPTTINPNPTNPTTTDGSKSTTTQNLNTASYFNIPYFLIFCSNVIMILHELLRY